MLVLDTYEDVTIGDEVTLKSGGPEMTVVGFEKPEPAVQPEGVAHASMTDVQAAVRCAWFLESGSPISAVFPLAALNVKDKGDDKPASDTKAPKTVA